MERISKKNYTITEAAELCAVNRVTFWRWAKAGRLKTYRTPTGQYRVKETDLKRFIKTHLPYIELEELSPARTILIVDDDSAFRDLLKRMFARDQFRLEEASNGFEAGIKIMKFMPEIVILDLFMPKMDGFDLCRQIKKDPATRHIKVIAVTGHASPETERRIRELRADAYLAKPFERKFLNDCVHELVQ